jgi:hypothetical protein
MTSNYAKAFELRKAIKLLNEADAIVQAALGASDNCYEVHCALEDLESTLEDYADNLIEMQITE